MVRFKNRYIVGELSKQDSIEETVIVSQSSIITAPEQRALLAHVKEMAEKF